MKSIILLPALILVTFTAFSQDTLYTKAGKTMNMKVVEIGLNKILYRHSYDNEKMYSIPMSDVASIHYANGTKDEFYYTPEPIKSSEPSKYPEPSKYNVAPDDSISNAVAKNNIPQNNTNQQVYSRNSKNQATAQAVFVGLRVIGLALRVALEVAASSNCHHSSSNYSNHHYSSNQPRGH